MSEGLRPLLLWLVMAALLLAVGLGQSWAVALTILSLCLVSAIMALGLNIQWGYAGLFNAGLMGFAALGGIAAVLVAMPPVQAAWSAGGAGVLGALAVLGVAGAGVAAGRRGLPPGRLRLVLGIVWLVGCLWVFRLVLDPAVARIEAIDPAATGYLGGAGGPILLSWIAGGALAAAAAWGIGRIALGLRSDYLAIATLGISEIVIATLRNEEWLSRGVKNVTGLPRPVPYEVDLQASTTFVGWVERWNANELQALAGAAREAALRQWVADAAGVVVIGSYVMLFTAVLVVLLWLAERAQRSPWGRMMRAIRDNEVAAAAMGKEVTARHLQVFVLGSALAGVAGAMLATIDGQFTPGSYNPLRFTFLVWVMVIVGGSGNNLGAVLGGFLIWFVWVQADPAGLWLVEQIVNRTGADGVLRTRLIDGAAHMRLILMGLLLLVVMRFSPRGLMPEKIRR